MIYFVRHGSTDWNENKNSQGIKEPKCQGRVDLELNEKGISQAKDLRARLIPYALFYLLRTMENQGIHLAYGSGSEKYVWIWSLKQNHRCRERLLQILFALLPRHIPHHTKEHRHVQLLLC